MTLPAADNFYLPERYHVALPERIRDYLRARGLTDRCIDDNLLGWNGWRITIPVMTPERCFGFFRLAKDPADRSELPKMLATPGSTAELYGWDAVSARPSRIVICEGEFDRLVLESRGFPAVTSTAGAATFRREWAEALAAIPEVYVVFDRDPAGEAGARLVASMLPKVRIAELPPEVGPGGDITDYFVRLQKTREDFLALLSQARPCLDAFSVRRPARHDPGLILLRNQCELERLKQLVPLTAVAGDRTLLRRSGRHLLGRCPLHDDRHPSFVIYESSQRFKCFGCGVAGDVVDFLQRTENLTFGQALRRLRLLAGQSHGEAAA